ncbi:MAG: CNNM domain-containing protein [Alphaproteobacteria bacterium]|jgi:Mg2+/Co2+ transporter CorB|nr:CNNM domain-containing protein [Alphaproteobacteria bacterium]
MENFNLEITTLIISIGCLILSAFFSAGETSIMSISKPYLLTQSQQGNWRAKLLSKMLNDPNNIITSLLIGNNVANIFFTTIITTMAIKLFGEGHTVIVGLAITFLVLMFAEILPKTYAFSNYNRYAIILAPFVFIFMIILRPISIFFIFINKIFLKLLVPKSNSNDLVAIANLRGAIEMLDREEEDKVIISTEKEMLHSILDLNELTVADIMKHRKNVLCIDIDDSMEENLKIIIESAYNRIPVFKDDLEHIIGVLNVKDVFRAYKEKENHKLDIKSLMKTPYFIPETTYVIDLLLHFREKNQRLALIVDEYGSFMGILTLGDILEEIAGDIKNTEQYQNNEYIHKVGSSYIVDGDYKIRDLNRKMSWKLPDEEFTTVAGLILFETGKIPNVGNIFVFYDFKFEIIEKLRHQLVKIKITPVEK